MREDVSTAAVVVMSPAELEALVERAVEKALKAKTPTPAASSGKSTITVPMACRRYGIGRLALMDLINNGKLPSTTRKMRGGRNGHVLRVVDCERVIAGAR